jgi:ABC-type transport system involved in multi-copper enzyme maturation permease subunit
VNRTIVLSTWEQRLKSPLRMTLAVLGFFLPLLGLWYMPIAGIGTLDHGFKFGVLIGAGLIGQDLSAGVLQLMFARPVTRWSYVMSRWFACVSFATVLTVAQVGLGALIVQMKGFPGDPSEAALFAGSQALAAIGIVSVLTLLSSLLGGFGDLGLYLVLGIIAAVMKVAGQVSGANWTQRMGDEVGRFLTPGLDLERMLSGPPVSWFLVSAYVATVVGCLALAVVLMNRRELSYASS